MIKLFISKQCPHLKIWGFPHKGQAIVAIVICKANIFKNDLWGKVWLFHYEKNTNKYNTSQLRGISK